MLSMAEAFQKPASVGTVRRLQQMDDQVTQLPWAEPDWLQQMIAWIEDQLANSDRESTGPVEVMHQRPWASL